MALTVTQIEGSNFAILESFLELMTAGYLLTKQRPVQITSLADQEIVEEENVANGTLLPLTVTTPGMDNAFFLTIKAAKLPATVLVRFTGGANDIFVNFLLTDFSQQIAIFDEYQIDDIEVTPNSNIVGNVFDIRFSISTPAEKAEVEPGNTTGSGTPVTIDNFKDLINTWIQNNEQANNRPVGSIRVRVLGPNEIP